MKHLLIMIVVLLSAAVAAANSCNQEAEPKHAKAKEITAAAKPDQVIHAGTQTHCPIGGGEVDKSVFEDYQGQRIYFCCPGCEGPFLADPEAHLTAISAKGQTVASVQTVCPISGKPLDINVFTEYAGRRVFFCCPDCRPALMAEPGKYLPNVK
jgi:YHS domain-containing protein